MLCAIDFTFYICVDLQKYAIEICDISVHNRKSLSMCTFSVKV